MTVPLLRRVTRWCCPNCDLTDVTTQALPPHTQFHTCRGLAGLWVPMVEEGTRCKMVAVEREDYISAEHCADDVQLAPGSMRPVASVVTTRDDGQDCTVYAPVAHASLGDW